jgi:hypothetical protein
MNRFYIIVIILFAGACSAEVLRNKQTEPQQTTTINLNGGGSGTEISLEFYKGKSFYYPLMAVWIEDEEGNFIQTLFVPRSVATGEFRFGKQDSGKWLPASKRAPQIVPYWSHKRGIKASDGLFMPDSETSVPDAYSGATPVNSFVLNTRTDKELPSNFRVLLEINQNWDWNEYWTNDKYPDDENYKWSCQPAVVYEVRIDGNTGGKRHAMMPIGHSHYSGKNGELYTDLSTLTTALTIADSVIVRVNQVIGDSQ